MYYQADLPCHQCYNKSVKSLLGVASAGEHCVLATRAEDSGTSGQFGLILCNAIGTPVDSMYYVCNVTGCFSSVLLQHSLDGPDPDS